jgi:hypothetical protein
MSRDHRILRVIGRRSFVVAHHQDHPASRAPPAEYRLPYTKTLYRLPETQRREAFGRVLRDFLESKDLFREIREDIFIRSRSVVGDPGKSN